MNLHKKVIYIIIFTLLGGVVFYVQSKIISSCDIYSKVNDGISFGISLWNLSFYLSFLGLAGVLWWIFVCKSLYHLIPLGLIYCGGLINLLDRIVNGGVTDYINMFGLYLNVADLLITFGVVFIIYELFIRRNKI